MDEQNENKRRTLLYDRDRPSDVPSGLPSESNSRASFEMTDDFRDTLSELFERERERCHIRRKSPRSFEIKLDFRRFIRRFGMDTGVEKEAVSGDGASRCTIIET